MAQYRALQRTGPRNRSSPLPIRGAYYSTSPTAVALRTYDVSPDGRRLLLIKEGEGSDEVAPVTQLNVVVNWFEELKGRMGGQVAPP